MYDVIIIGAGPAGMMAAITAAENRKKVLLLDKNARLGRKLLITGKGRCNVTNSCTNEELLNNIPTNPKFLYSAVSKFSPNDTMNFFEWRNVPLKTERGNRVFPESDKAFDIEKALEDECRLLEVDVRVGEAVKILTEENSVVGVKCKNGEYFAKSVIIATGGKSYPLTGSTGDGYKLAKALGHSVTKIIPSLVPLVSNDIICSELQGLSLRNVELSLFEKEEKKPIFKELGEMLFTHFGISGPLVLSASSHIREMEEDRYYVSIDLKPGLDEKKLDMRITRDFSEYQNKALINGLNDLLPKKLIPVVVERSEIPGNIKINQITKQQRQALVSAIKDFRVSISDYRPIDEAIVTSGGISVDEINPKTMESKLIKGLFFAGEVIDVDGYTGGFNLQIAFSTGYVAGLNS